MTTTEAAPRPMHPDVADAVKAGERFAETTAEHKLTVLHDEGLYRHLLFKKPGSSFYWFEVVTWPGTLTITGDMGTFTFRRDDDMIAFFRSNPDRKLGNQYRINSHYWAEKVQEGIRSGGRDSVREFSKDRLAASLLYTAESRTEDWVQAARDALYTAIKTDLIASFAEDSPTAEHDACEAILDFKFNIEDAKPTRAERLEGFDPRGEDYSFAFDYEDTYDNDRHRYSPFFLWNLHAIVNCIEAYDAQRAAQAEQTAEVAAS